ncbi:MAG: prepilin-type N-terminal cleavage/methylation domain-containing protein [Deltaproteobacteria bacterium]|nr:prepilin-type N-terminal cleavage/methylation domain-containing protein [Deltaproteobacteria bacterium]
MAAPAPLMFPNPQSAIHNPQSRRGFSLLDLLITLLVLGLVLLAAVYQFSNYQKSEIPPAPPAQSAPAQH